MSENYTQLTGQENVSMLKHILPKPKNSDDFRKGIEKIVKDSGIALSHMSKGVGINYSTLKAKFHPTIDLNFTLPQKIACLKYLKNLGEELVKFADCGLAELEVPDSSDAISKG